MNTKASPAVIVTGASRGIGWAAARWLGAAGATVILNARSRAPLEALAAAIQAAGGRAHVAVGDVADRDDCRSIVAAALERAGRIDALVNNAGRLEPIGRIGDAEPEGWRRSWEVNVLAPILLTRAALPELRRSRGRVVNVSSGAATHPVAGWGAYCQAKAALNMFTELLAVEEPEVVAVAVRPGVVDTRMQQVIRETGARGMDRAEHLRFRELHASGRLLPPAGPGRALAVLALRAPSPLSGRFLSWDAPEVRALLEAGS